VSPLAASLVVFALIFGGTLFGMLLRVKLPEPHLSAESKEVVRLATGLVATIAALVLGLLIASAKTSYDTQSTQVQQMTANVILLDGLLARYGDEALPVRRLLRRVTPSAGQTGDQNGSAATPAPYAATAAAAAFYERLEELSPHTDVQRSLHQRAIRVATDLAQTRLMMFAEADNLIPMPFLVVLVSWLTIIFASFSLFARPNATVVAALFLCALSAATAIFLILELSQPFTGLIRISIVPLTHALAPLGP
jgi:hypothetical protein